MNKQTKHLNVNVHPLDPPTDLVYSYRETRGQDV